MIAMDVLRVQEKSKLARELIQRGIATDFEQASRMIDERGMIKESGFRAVERTHAEVQQKKAEAGYGQISPSSSSQSSVSTDVRLERIERGLNELRDFVMRYAKANDSNLKELDHKLRGIVQSSVQTAPKATPVTSVDEVTVEEVTMPDQRPQQKQQTLPQEKSYSSRHPQSSLDPSNFSVDKYFNNAHGKMLQKK